MRNVGTYLAATLALRGNFSNETMLKFTSLIIIQINYYSRITCISSSPSLSGLLCKLLLVQFLNLKKNLRMRIFEEEETTLEKFGFPTGFICTGETFFSVMVWWLELTLVQFVGDQ